MKRHSTQQGMMLPLIIGIIALVLIGIVVWFFFMRDSKPEPQRDPRLDDFEFRLPDNPSPMVLEEGQEPPKPPVQENASSTEEESDEESVDEDEPESEEETEESEDETETTEEEVQVEGDQAVAEPLGTYEAYATEKLANAATGDVVLYFHADWCPSCRSTESDLSQKKDDIPSGLTILKVNYDEETALKQKYGVTYQHTFVQVDEEGKKLKQWGGSITLEDIQSEVL